MAKWVKKQGKEKLWMLGSYGFGVELLNSLDGRWFARLFVNVTAIAAKELHHIIDTADAQRTAAGWARQELWKLEHKAAKLLEANA